MVGGTAQSAGGGGGGGSPPTTGWEESSKTARSPRSLPMRLQRGGESLEAHLMHTHYLIALATQLHTITPSHHHTSS